MTMSWILLSLTKGIVVSRLAILEEEREKITSFEVIPFSRHACRILRLTSIIFFTSPSTTAPCGVGTRTHPYTVGFTGLLSICTIRIVFAPTRTTTTFFAIKTSFVIPLLILWISLPSQACKNTEIHKPCILFHDIDHPCGKGESKHNSYINNPIYQSRKESPQSMAIKIPIER